MKESKIKTIFNKNKTMPPKKYFFQQKERTFAQKFFNQGFTTTSSILLALKEAGEMCLEEMPDCYFRTAKKMFGVGKYKRPEFKKETLRVNFYRLEKKGLIAKDSKKKVYCLTEEGKKFTAFIKDRFDVLKKPWDGKFRIVSFDIPENKKGWRRWLRRELLLLQFQMLQQSVYIGKHPLSEGLYQDIEQAGLSGYVFVLTVGEIDKKEEILKMFE